MLAAEDDRRLELEHVVPRSFSAEQDTARLHTLDDIGRFPIGRFERGAVADQVNAEE